MNNTILYRNLRNIVLLLHVCVFFTISKFSLVILNGPQVQTAKVTSRVFAIKASGWNNDLPEAQRFAQSLNSLHFKRADFLTLCKQNYFTFCPYRFLWCQHFVALCIYTNVWCEYHGIHVVEAKITPYWQKLPKTTQWISTRIVFLGLQSVGYFSCFVENLPNIKILNSKRSQTNTAKHIPENRRRIQEEEEEESKIKWKAIVTTTTQWNNKNEYLNIYIWLEDHCVILDINRIINVKKAKQTENSSVYFRDCLEEEQSRI